MKKIILSGLSGVVIGILIAAFLFAKFQPRPGPATVTEVSHPTQNTIQEQGHGHLVGSVPWKPPAAQNEPVETDEGNNSPDPGQDPPGPAFGTYTIPVAGELTTQYFYGGQQVGTGTHQITGETTVTLAPEGITANTQFSDISNLRFDIPEQPWSIYLGVKTDFNQINWFGGVEYSRAIRGSLYGSARAEYDGKAQIAAMLGYKFGSAP